MKAIKLSVLAMALIVLMFTGCATAGSKSPEPPSTDRLAEIQALIPAAERKVKATDEWIEFYFAKGMLERMQEYYQDRASKLYDTPEYKEYIKLFNEKSAIEKSMKTKERSNKK